MRIREFARSDQAVAAELILSGLEEHWGWRDPTLNADLIDIARSFADGCFLIGADERQIIATGGLLPRGEGSAEIVRMSVARDRRRQGIGTEMLETLCKRAESLGFQRVILETTAAWEEVVQFYETRGFTRAHDDGDDAYFLRDLFANESA